MPLQSTDLGPLAVTVLGSGSPFPTAHRTSSSYLVWIDGRPLMLIDAGGGTFERIGQLGIDLSELELVALTHTHIDHSGGLAPIVFASWMNGRTRPLALLGPSGRDQHPGTVRFCDQLFGPNGAWNYLHTFEGFAIDAHEAPSEPGVRSTPAVRPGGAEVSTVGVPHGMMPALSVRVDHAGHSVGISGDLEGADDGLTSLASDVGLLIHDQSLPSREAEHGALHLASAGDRRQRPPRRCRAPAPQPLDARR